MSSSVLIAPNLTSCRYESDMLAFSGCYYGGGEKEKRELGAIRKRWKTLHVSHSPRKFDIAFDIAFEIAMTALFFFIRTVCTKVLSHVYSA